LWAWEGPTTQAKPAVRAAQALFFLNAAVWLAFGIVWLVDTSGRTSVQVTTAWIVGILMFGNVLAMLLCGIGLGTYRRLFYFLALAVLAANLVLTFTDQVGLFDWITAAVDLVLLALLVATRRLYSVRSLSGSPSA